MPKAIFKLFMLSVSLVMLLAVAGFEQRVDLHGGAKPPTTSRFEMGRNRPPVRQVQPEPSVFDWVRYAMAGGPYGGGGGMRTAQLDEGMSDMQKLHYRADVDRRGMEAMTDRVEDMVRARSGSKPVQRGIQFESPD